MAYNKITNQFILLRTLVFSRSMTKIGSNLANFYSKTLDNQVHMPNPKADQKDFNK